MPCARQWKSWTATRKAGVNKLIRVPPLSCCKIRKVAEDFLQRFQPDALHDDATDIERFFTVTIAQKMGMVTGSDDLSPYGDDVLGVTEVARKRSFVSSELYNSSSAVNQRRCRATMAHEAGHCIHHVTYARLASTTAVGTLFRKASDLKPFENPEWQAWEFARQFLMPEAVFRRCLAERYTASDLVERFDVNRSFVETWRQILRQRDANSARRKTADFIR